MRCGVITVSVEPYRSFFLAGGHRNSGSPADPKWVPPAYADTRTAWQGAYPGLPQTKLRVEAASYRGRPVYFQVVDEWTRAARISPLPPAPATKVSQGIVIVLVLLVITVGVLLACHNLKPAISLHGRPGSWASGG